MKLETLGVKIDVRAACGKSSSVCHFVSITIARKRPSAAKLSCLIIDVGENAFLNNAHALTEVAVSTISPARNHINQAAYHKNLNKFERPSSA